MNAAALLGVAALLVGFIAMFIGQGVAEKKLQAWKDRADSLAIFAAVQQDIANLESMRGDSLRISWQREKSKGYAQQHRIDSILAALPSTPTVVPDTCLPWANKVKGLEEAIVAQVVRITTLQREATLAEAEATTQRSRADRLQGVKDSLTSLIRDLPAPPKRSPVTIGPGVGVAFVNGGFKPVPVLSVHIPISVGKLLKSVLPF